MSSHIASTGHIQGLSWSLVNQMGTLEWGSPQFPLTDRAGNGLYEMFSMEPSVEFQT